MKRLNTLSILALLSITAIEANTPKTDNILMHNALKVAQEKPLDFTHTYPAIAWEVPVDYFNEVKKNFGEDMAQKYQKYAEYFSSIVKPWEIDYISEFLKDVFNWAWDKELLNDFLEEVSWVLKDWEKISDSQIDSMVILLTQSWEVLDKDIEKSNMAIASNLEIIRKLEVKILKAKNELILLESELSKSKSELSKSKSELSKKIEKIKELKKLIKQ